MRRIAAALTAAGLLMTVSYATATLLGRDDPSPAGPAIAVAAPRLAELDRLIGVFEKRRTDNTDVLDYRTLGGFYLDRAALTGDIDDYRMANTVLNEAITLAPQHLPLIRLRADGALAVHDFDTALQLSASALALDPYDAAALLIAADANLELGRIDAAVTQLDRLTLLARSHPALLVRRAEVAHLRGDQTGAVAAAALAYDRARELGSKGRSLAFYRLFQADLVLDLGLYEEAADLVDAALDLAPDWSQGHASQGRVLSAMGQYGSAVNSYTNALELQPDDPEWLAARADLLAASGDPTAAAGDLARAIEILSAEDPVIYGRSLSRLYSDHNIEPGDALRLAEADLARRQDVLGYDTYAWALYRNGRHAEAVDAIQPVIASGLHDADAQLHAGLILVAAGDLQSATSHLEWVMTINPGFHPLLAQEAHAAISGSDG